MLETENKPQSANAEPKIRAKWLVVLALACFTGAAAWVIFSDDIVRVYLQSRWFSWFGRAWHDQPTGLYRWAEALVTFVPAVLLMGMFFLAGQRFTSINAPVRHRNNLTALGAARSALERGLESVNDIEREYKNKLTAFERLQAQLADLASVREMDVEDLRRKLGAISQASRRSLLWERGLGFALGVLASLLASFIWEKISAGI